MFGYVKKWPHFFLSLIENERDDYNASVNMADDFLFNYMSISHYYVHSFHFLKNFPTWKYLGFVNIAVDE